MMSHRPTTVNGRAVPYGAPLPELLARLRPPGPEAWAAILAIGNCASTEAFTALVELTRDPDWRYRRSALEALLFHPLLASAAPLFLAALADASPHVMHTACNAVATLQLSQAHDAVAQLLDSRDAETRETSVRALSSVWRPSDFDRVTRARADGSEGLA